MISERSGRHSRGRCWREARKCAPNRLFAKSQVWLVLDVECREIGIPTNKHGDPIPIAVSNQKSSRRATWPVRFPSFSAVCADWSTPNVLGSLTLVAGGARW
jgi:hypothetical protein